MGTLNRRPFAVVTGAASGIGFELARQCVEHELDVMICADDARGIHEAARHLVGTNVIAVTADLATHEGVEKLAREIESTGRHVDALIVTAIGGIAGPFIETPLDEELQMIALNCSSLVHLAKHVVPQMAVRGKGRVLITAPIARTAYLAVSDATKAFALAFAEALRDELKDTGVTVTALQATRDDAKMAFDAMMAGHEVSRSSLEDVLLPGLSALARARRGSIRRTRWSRR